MLVTKKRLYHEKYDTILKVPATLHIQVWDNDTFSPDDFLGSMSMNLSSIPEPAATLDKCDFRKIKKHLNLFQNGVVRGWFPVLGSLQNGSSLGQTVS
jgi:Ca2+-dependent lipid-binding protein